MHTHQSDDFAAGPAPMTLDLPGTQRLRVEKLRLNFVCYPHLDKILQSLERLHHYGTAGVVSGSPARTLLLTGESGSGKSAALKYWIAEHPMVVGPLGNYHSVLYVEVPKRVSTKALAQETLKALGQPMVANATEAQLVARVKTLLVRHEVRTLIYDEAQHLVDSRDNKKAYQAADFIKSLLNESTCSIVLSGLPEAGAIFRENVQLARRASARLTMRAFAWEDKNSRLTFQALLKDFATSMDFVEVPPIHKTGVAQRIHHAAQGHFGRAADLIVDAYTLAVDGASDTVDIRHLSAAIENLRDYDDPDWFNPFDVEDARLAQACQAPPRDQSRKTSLHARPRKLTSKDVAN